ncbi:MAG: hypothetical protein E7057_05740 [Lentisphaerae bacterium]|nr:hypothetical protein [Lentisphaerota bacterium]
MKKVFVLLFAVMFFTGIHAGEVAHYTLRDGKGTAVKESSGRLPDGKIRKSIWTLRNDLPLVDFNGIATSRGAVVDLPQIDFKGEFTIAVWVLAYWHKPNWAPIVYRSDATYGIRNNRINPGQLIFRVKDRNIRKGTNLKSDTILVPNRWYHVAAVFKPGKYMELYINGKLDSRMSDRIPKELAVDDQNFRLGYSGKGNEFAGVLNDLHFFDHALSGREVAELYRRENRFSVETDDGVVFPEKGKKVFEKGSLSVYSHGALEFAGKFRMDTIFSYPAKPVMKFNAFAAGKIKDVQGQWNPQVNMPQITASGENYTVTRRITEMPGKRFKISETVRNTSKSDQALVYLHRINPVEKVDHWYLFGQENARSSGDERLPAANPTLFIKSGKEAFAIVAEDDISRALIATQVSDTGKDKMRFDFGCRIGIPAGKSHTLEYSVYLLDGDYFDFINRLRSDWQVPQVTLNGPYGSCRTDGFRSEVYKRLAADKEAFRKEFERRNMRVITITAPGVHSFGKPEEFKAHIQQVMKTIRAVNPDAKFLACLVAYYHTLTEKDFTTPAPADFEWNKLTPGTVKRIMESPWQDSASKNSRGMISIYPRTGITGHMQLMTHPIRGNHFHLNRLKEIDWLLDEVGFDGVYTDMFGFSSQSSRQYDKWDGFSVAINLDGTIAGKYTSLGPATAPARADWLRRIIGKGKIALTNFGAPTTRELQTIPYFNFTEAAGRGVGRQDLASIPPDSSGCAMNQLSTPLGYGPHRSEEVDASRLMARVRAYLRYGCLYVHTSMRNSFPETGEKGGSYAAINHMFPITPVELHRGWVKGKERIVSCVSYKTEWDKEDTPKVLRFDAVGRPVEVNGAARITGTPGKWNIEVKINDWKEFVIIE